ncbi:hypothetical protein [Pedobacter sp. SL55]|uniref:hypothetical protein n=1 Tax=Pedobacter sp. SL55 TaxID=2995161 RepID=UPI00227175D8|nr:hypothetical protein [Pedobacter sp. SL55]WAC42585.1 hypothetical protein OVA16_09585 [Pedobacter sp. SL55]
MENNKTVNLAEKAKAIAITLIGAGIFSQGTFYFKAQNSYNIPRILYPVFELLGHVGLAVAMLFLGLALVYWAYTKWKNGNGKPNIFGMIAVAAFGLFFAILLITGNKKTTTEELMKASEEARAKGIEKIQATDKPDFGIPEVDAHFAAFEKLLQEYKAAYKNENEHEMAAKQNAFIEWNKKSAELMQKLQTPEQKQQFSQYLGKLSMQWQAAK